MIRWRRGCRTLVAVLYFAYHRSSYAMSLVVEHCARTCCHLELWVACMDLGVSTSAGGPVSDRATPVTTGQPMSMSSLLVHCSLPGKQLFQRATQLLPPYAQFNHLSGGVVSLLMLASRALLRDLRLLTLCCRGSFTFLFASNSDRI